MTKTKKTRHKPRCPQCKHLALQERNQKRLIRLKRDITILANKLCIPVAQIKREIGIER